MELHHTKHHQTYVNGLNVAEASLVKVTSTKELIALQPALKFNGGGHINHSLFWKNLSPANEDGGKLPNGPLRKALVADFGSVEDFKKQMNTITAAIQGSGWGWLVCGFASSPSTTDHPELTRRYLRGTTNPPRGSRLSPPLTKTRFSVSNDPMNAGKWIPAYGLVSFQPMSPSLELTFGSTFVKQ